MTTGAGPAAGRRRDDRGSALVEVTWLAILLLVPLVYVLLAVFDVQRGAFGVSAASRAAGRAFALAPSDGEGLSRAHAAAAVALGDQGVDEFDLVVACTPVPTDCLAPGSVVTVTVRSQVDLPLVPAALGGGAPSVRVQSVHRVPVGRYVEGG